MTNFNEQTNTLLYKNISLTLYSRKGWCWLCVRDELETGTDCYIDPAVLLSHFGWVAQPWVTVGPKPSVCRWLSIRHLVSNWRVFQNTQILSPSLPGMTSFTLHSIYGLLQLWLSYPLRASVNCTQYLCTWTKSRIVQSPTKLNDKI